MRRAVHRIILIDGGGLTLAGTFAVNTAVADGATFTVTAAVLWFWSTRIPAP